ncbi:hypothetical protein HKD37_20G056159 [Glycine soja]
MMIGSLLPMSRKQPKFAQLHIYDTEHEVQNRLQTIKLKDEVVLDVKLKLIFNREKDERIYNIPIVSEVVVLITRDANIGSTRDIILKTQTGQLQRINELHTSYLALQYPLLFPYGEDGYRHDVQLTIREWFCFRLQFRPMEAQTILHSRRLFQQFIVDGYTMVESERLSFIKRNQSKLGVDKYYDLRETSKHGAIQGSNRGKQVILPSTFVGSRRYMDYYVGFLDLFITFTCNPNMYTIEFQKGGLPHAHLLLFLHPSSKVLHDEALQLSDDELKNLTLLEIEKLLRSNEQLQIFNQIMQVVIEKKGGIFFLYRYTSLLLPSGRTTHSKFRIPMPTLDDSVCNITQGSDLAEFLKVTSQGNTVYIPRLATSPSQSPWPFKLIRRKFPIIVSYAMTINKSQGQLLASVGLYLPTPVQNKNGLKVMIYDKDKKPLSTTTNVVFKEVFQNL